MGYTHYFKKKKDVPDPQWKTLCEKVAEVYQDLPTHEMREDCYEGYLIEIYDCLGDKQIAESRWLFDTEGGVNFIVFNGNVHEALDHETFVLRQKGEQEYCEWFCKTARKPYDWFVTTVLILLYNLCPGCYELRSDGDKEWLPVVKWLNEALKAEYVVPFHVIVPQVSSS